MMRRVPHVIAIVLACSTVLAGVPLIAASAPPDPQAGPCVAPVPLGPEGLSAARGETVEEEREEEQENGGPELDLFTGARGDAILDTRHIAIVTPAACPTAAGSFVRGHSIRGPPAR